MTLLQIVLVVALAVGLALLAVAAWRSSRRKERERRRLAEMARRTRAYERAVKEASGPALLASTVARRPTAALGSRDPYARPASSPRPAPHRPASSSTGLDAATQAALYSSYSSGSSTSSCDSSSSSSYSSSSDSGSSSSGGGCGGGGY